MSDKKPSQTQQAVTSARDALAVGIDAFARLTEDNIARVNALFDELSDIEVKAYQRARKVMEDAASVGVEWLDYQKTLAAEWRRAALEATRRAADMVSQASQA